MISIYCNTQVPKAMTLMCHTEKEENAMKRHAKGTFYCLVYHSCPQVLCDLDSAAHEVQEERGVCFYWHIQN